MRFGTWAGLCLTILTCLYGLPVQAENQACKTGLVPFPKVEEMHWLDRNMPSPALFGHTFAAFKKAQDRLKAQQTPLLYLISSFQTLLESSKGLKSFLHTPHGIAYRSKKTPDVIQYISENQRYDNAMITQSTLNSKPHEVAQIKIKARNGRAHVSAVIIGEGYNVNVGTVKDYDALIAAAENNRVKPFEIEINHTHPLAQMVMVDDQGSPTCRLAVLSGADIGIAKRTSLDFLDIYVTIRAITPGGFTFSATFLNGQQVEPLPHRN